MAIDLSELPRYDPIPAISREFVKARVKAFEQGAPVDPVAAGATTVWAFTPIDPAADPTSYSIEPSTVDWVPGEFEKSGEAWFTRVLVGVGSSAALGVGQYVAWAQVDNAPELPTRAVGIVTVV